MRPAPTVQELVALLSDRSWGPESVYSVRRPAIDYGVSSVDIIDLNQVAWADESLESPATLCAEVVRAHAGRRSRWAMPRSRVSELLARELEAAGYACLFTLAMAKDLAGLDPAAPTVEEVLDLEALRDWHRVRVSSGRAVGVPSEAELQEELALGRGSGGRYRQLLVREGGQVLSAGGILHYPEVRAGYLWGGGTANEGRRRGAYRALIEGRLALLAGLGCERAWTVTLEGTPARAFRALGFVEVAPYFIFERPRG